jgi:hypothetical protein
MAEKLTINQKPVVKMPRNAGRQAKSSRLPLAITMAAAGCATLAFSFTQVGKVSPKRGDVEKMVKQIQSEKPKDAKPLPAGINPTRGTKLWAKKGGQG